MVQGEGAAATDIPNPAEVAAPAARTLPGTAEAFWAAGTRPLDVIVHERFERLAKTAKSLARKSSAAREKVLAKHIEELASLLGETPKKSINFGGQLKFIREMAKNAARNGWSAGEIGVLTSSALYDSGAIRSATGAKNLQNVLATYEAEIGMGGATPRLVKGASAAARVGKTGRAIATAGKFAKSAAPFAALMALDAFTDRRSKVMKEEQQIQRILEKASGGGMGAFGPMQTVEFIEAMGPEFIESMMQDPSLVIALHDRLQSVATGNLPRGTAVLRTAAGQAGAGLDPEMLLRQLGGE
jgi:hypothetical protein